MSLEACGMRRLRRVGCMPGLPDCADSMNGGWRTRQEAISEQRIGAGLGNTDRLKLHEVSMVGLEATDVLVEGMVGWDVKEVAARVLEEHSAEGGREGGREWSGVQEEMRSAA